MNNVENFLRHFPALFYYAKNRNNTRSIKVAMAMQVKDESDIIELNIRYHAAKGCEAFFIVDNGSTDGTLDILQSLSKEFLIYLYQDSRLGHNQGENMTWMTYEARKKGYDWVIENDADEFWYPKSGDYRTNLSFAKGVFKVRRHNVLPLMESDGVNWLLSPWRTENTLRFNDRKYNEGMKNFLLDNVAEKVLVNAHGFVRVPGGNHSATHVIDKLNFRGGTAAGMII